jgi:hypothetical protein
MYACSRTARKTIRGLVAVTIIIISYSLFLVADFRKNSYGEYRAYFHNMQIDKTHICKARQRKPTLYFIIYPRPRDEKNRIRV